MVIRGVYVCKLYPSLLLVKEYAHLSIKCVNLPENILTRCGKDWSILYWSLCAEHQRMFQQSAAKASCCKIYSCLSLVSLECGDIEEFKIQKMMKRNCRDPRIVFLSPILLSRPQASKIFFNLLSSADLSWGRDMVIAQDNTKVSVVYFLLSCLLNITFKKATSTTYKSSLSENIGN